MLNLPESVYNDDVIHHNDDPWETTDNEYDGNHYENDRQALLTCTVARSSQFSIKDTCHWPQIHIRVFTKIIITANKIQSNLLY